MKHTIMKKLHEQEKKHHEKNPEKNHMYQYTETLKKEKGSCFYRTGKGFLMLFLMVSTFVILSSSAFSYESDLDNILDGMVSYYTLDETSGTTAIDSHGSNDGTLIGSVSWSENGKINGATNHAGGSQNQGIQIPADSGFNDGSVTYSFWIKPDSLTTAYYRLMENFRDSGVGYSDYNLLIAMNSRGDGWLNVLGYKDGTNDDYRMDVENAITTTTDFSHVVVTWDNTNTQISVYINGEFKQDATWSNGINRYSFSIRFGGSIKGETTNIYKGLMDEVAIWNRSLSSDEVSALYQAQSDGFQYPFEFDVDKDSEIQTQPASMITSNSVRLHGNVTTYTFPTNVSFEYREGTSGSFLSTSSQTIGNDTENQTFFHDLTGLDDDTLYQFRAKGVFFNGTDNVTIYGDTLNFTTDVLQSIAFSFVNQSPDPITHLNVFGGVNITYSITNKQIASTPYLNYTFSSTASCFEYVNGVCDVPTGTYFQKDVSTITGTNHLFRLFDTALLPATYNWNESDMNSREKSFLTRSGSNRFAKIQLSNVDPLAEIMYLEAYLDALVPDTDVLVYYCNENYVDGSPLSSGHCTIAGVFRDVQSYHHMHSIHSFHNLLKLPVLNGEINGLTITNTSYILLGNVDGGTFRIAYIEEDTGTFWSSNNNANSWTTLSGTADMHLHQMRLDDGVSYQACGIGSDSLLGCSSFRTSVFNTASEDPIDPVVVITFPMDSIVYPVTSLTPSIQNGEVVYSMTITYQGFSFDQHPLLYEVYVNNVLVYDGSDTNVTIVGNDYLGENVLRVVVIEDVMGGLFAESELSFTISDSDVGVVPGTPFSWSGEVDLLPGTCPSSMQGILYVIIFLVFAGWVATLGMKKSGLLLIFSGLMFGMLSLYMVACFPFMAYSLFALGIFFIVMGYKG